MSLDIDLEMELDTGGPSPHVVTLASKNITHNVVPMWKHVGVYSALYESDGLLAGETLPELRQGLSSMASRLEECRALNPPNGWGDADSALEWLRQWLAACEAHPKARIRVCR